MPVLVHGKAELSVSTMFTYLSQDNELRCLRLFYKWEISILISEVVWARASSPWLPVVWPGLVLPLSILGRVSGVSCIIAACQISKLLRYRHSWLAFLLNFLERLNLPILNQPNLYGSFHVCFPCTVTDFRIPHFISSSTLEEGLQ